MSDKTKKSLAIAIMALLMLFGVGDACTISRDGDKTVVNILPPPTATSWPTSTPILW